MVDVSSVIGTTTEFEYRLGHQIVGLPSLSDQNGSEPAEIDVQDDIGRSYTVYIHENEDYCRIEYSLNIAAQLIHSMSTEERDHFLSQPLASDLQIPNDNLRAAVVRIESEYRDQLEEIWPDLEKLLKASGLNCGPITTPAGTAAGFTVARKIFPDQDSFTIQRYTDCVRTVAVTGDRRFDFLLEETNILDDDLDPTELEKEGTEVEFRSFH